MTRHKAHKVVLSACSTVFKSIINDLPHNSSVIYLRGIQHQEMESILQFMYLGEVTLSHKTMKEFLEVAKNLEIKEIIGDEELEINETIDSQDLSKDETELMNDEDLDVSEEHQNTDSEDVPKGIVSPLKLVDGMFSCSQCEIQLTTKTGMIHHQKSKHEGVKYDCEKCDYKATHKSSLKAHTLSKHTDIKHYCNLCDYQATTQSSIRLHILSKHDGVKFPCEQCNQHFNSRNSLRVHKKRSNHH